MLDVLRLLRNRNIPYKGAKTGEQVKVDCPQCGGRFKLWIVVQPFMDLDGNQKHPGMAYCHRCLWRPSDEEVFVKTLTGIWGLEGMKLWKEYQCLPDVGNNLAAYIQEQLSQNPWAGMVRTSEGSRSGKKEPISWPEGYVPLWHPDAVIEAQYALSRGITFQAASYHQVGACTRGEYWGYLILPTIIRGELVFWQGREARGRTNYLRYRTPGGYSSSYSLFNLDTACQFDEVILCEGWISSYKMGLDTCGTLGNRISREQIELLKSRGVRNIVLCFDPDSWMVPEPVRKRSPGAKPPLYTAIMYCLGHFDSVRVARLVGGDPDDLGPDIARYYVNQARGVASQLDVLRLWL